MSTVVGGYLWMCSWYCSGGIGVGGTVDQVCVWVLCGIGVTAGWKVSGGR